MWLDIDMSACKFNTGGAVKSLARPGRNVRRSARFQQHGDARCHKGFSSLQVKAPKEIHAILTEILSCFFPGRAKDLSEPLKLNMPEHTQSLRCSLEHGIVDKVESVLIRRSQRPEFKALF